MALLFCIMFYVNLKIGFYDLHKNPEKFLISESKTKFFLHLLHHLGVHSSRRDDILLTVGRDLR